MTEDNAPDAPLYNWETIPAFDYDGIPVRGFRGDNVGIAYSELHPGAKMKPPHSHDFEQIFMILKGRVRLHVGDRVHECGPGSIIRIPPNVEHWVEPPRKEDGVAINLDVFSPIRADFEMLTAYQS